MLTTLEAVIEAPNQMRLLKPLPMAKHRRRAFLVVIDDIIDSPDEVLNEPLTLTKIDDDDLVVGFFASTQPLSTDHEAILEQSVDSKSGFTWKA